jgi:hypothetical protein
MSKELSRYFKRIGSRGGKLSAASMTKKQRVERARLAGKAAAAARASKAKKRGGRNAGK